MAFFELNLANLFVLAFLNKKNPSLSWDKNVIAIEVIFF
jgi:hypothetical protein